MEIAHVRMMEMPNDGPSKITEITETEACAIKNSAFSRPGNVSVQGIENGYQIKDSNGITTLIAVFK